MGTLLSAYTGLHIWNKLWLRLVLPACQTSKADLGHYTELFGHSGRFLCCGPEDRSLSWAEPLIESMDEIVNASTTETADVQTAKSARVPSEVFQEYFEMYDKNHDLYLSELEVRQALDLDH